VIAAVRINSTGYIAGYVAIDAATKAKKLNIFVDISIPARGTFQTSMIVHSNPATIDEVLQK